MSRRNAVRVQNPGDLVWDDAREGQPLHRDQTLMTLEGSKAEVAFLDGAGLVLDENSMVRLERSPGEAGAASRFVVTLLRGKLHKRAGAPAPKSAAPLEIRVGSTRADAPADSELVVAVTPESVGSGEILVRSGDVQVRSAGGTITAHPGERVTLPTADSAELPAARKAALAPITPAPGEVIAATAGEASRVRFSWNIDPKQTAGGPLELEASPDPQFRSQVVKTTISAAHPPLERAEARLAIPVSEGSSTWHWRVRSLATGAASAPERFVVQTPPKPRLVHPPEGAQVRAGKTVDLVWEALEGIEGYEVEVRPGDGPARMLTAKKSLASVAGLSPGDCSWRVRARLREGAQGPWSVTRHMKLWAPEAAPPPPVELLEPEFVPQKKPDDPKNEKKDGASLWNWLVSPAHAEEAAPPELPTFQIKLKWKAVPGVKGYRIQIARTESFAEVLSEGEPDAPEWSWGYRLGMENRKGRVFYRVASISASGKVGRFSAPKAVDIPKDILALARKSAPKVAPTPLPSPSPSPAPTVAAEPAEPELGPEPPMRQLAWSGAYFIGFGSQSQKSGETNLKSVKLTAPHLQQRIALRGDVVGADDQLQWSAILAAQFASYGAPDTLITTVQPVVRAFQVRADVLRWRRSQPSAWKLVYGGIVGRAYRWKKTGLQSVEPAGALTLGPKAMAVRKYGDKGSWLVPQEAGFALALPIAGAALKGSPLGVEGTAWGEWKIASIKPGWIGLMLDAGGAYLRFRDPASASMVTWNAWLAPTFHLRGGDADFQ